MKNIYKIITLLFVSIVLVSCQRDQGDTDYLNDRGNTIFFAKSSAILFVEDGAPNTIEIAVGATALASGEVPYNITLDPASTAVEGVDFTILNSTTSLINGNIISKLRIKGNFENALVEGKTAIFNLSASGDVEVSDNNQFTLELFKLCPFTGLNTSNYTASVTAFDAEAPSYVLTLDPVPGTDNQWTVYSGWGPTFVSWATGNSAYDNLYIYSGTIVLNSDFTIDFIGNDAWATGGSGNFSPCTQEFSYTLSQGLFTTSFTVDVVLTPN